MDRLRILVADDSEFMRLAYKQVLEDQAGFRVVAMAADGEEAVESCTEKEPDIAILDIRMPKLDGIEVAHRVLDHHPSTGIVIISAYDNLSFVADLLRYGLERRAYLLKSSLADISELVRTVRAVNTGQTVLDPGIVNQLARLYCKHSSYLTTSLSETEQDMLGLMAEGYDDLYIGGSMQLEQAQVVEHSGSMFEKLGLAGGSDLERRIKAIQAFVGQIHLVPLTTNRAPMA